MELHNNNLNGSLNFLCESVGDIWMTADCSGSVPDILCSCCTCYDAAECLDATSSAPTYVIGHCALLQPTTYNCSENETLIQIELLTDDYGEETSWDIKDVNNNSNGVVNSGSTYDSASIYNIDFCIPADTCYEFTIYDSYGDGICCYQGDGSYTVWVNGTNVTTGGDFGHNETTVFGYDCRTD